MLPAGFAETPERRSRFAREAKLLASLNHPNIAAIYGLEESDGVHYLVLELVPGETLAEKIKLSPLPVDEALDTARQIAEALDTAHENGVIHRDLKPANIKITPEGQVKVLDFGLAKAFVEDAQNGSMSDSPTLSAMATREGIILGTAPYMSPEQARGKPVDKRSDIFSFGSVLYEMLTGRPAFLGDDVSDTLAAVLKTEPDWSLLPANTDARIRALLRACLQKDRKARRRDIGDVRAEIGEVLAHRGREREEIAAAPPAELGWKRAIPLALAVSLVVGVIAGIIGWNLKPEPPPRPVARFPMVLPSDQQLTDVGRRVVVLSPDGRRLVYVANNQVYLREMDQMEATPIRGTEGGRSPFFSPDGEWLGFQAEGKLKKVSIRGGASVTLCDAGDLYGASWAPDDIIVFGQGPRGIWQVSANGGTAEVLVPLDSKKGESGHGPQILPGGKAVLFTLGAGMTWDDAQIVVQSLETGERRVLIEGASDARYVPTGHLVYARAETVLAVPFDLARLEVTPGPVPVLEHVVRPPTRITIQNLGAAPFSFSDSGSLVYVPGGGETHRKLVWVDRQGKATPLTEKRGTYDWPRLSPDGERLALWIEEQGRNDIWIYDIERDSLSRLTTEGDNTCPAWSPDGQWVAFLSDRAGDPDLYRKRADFSGPAERILTREYLQTPMSWSSDSKLLIYQEAHPATGRDIWVLPLEGDGEPRPFLQIPFNDRMPDLSPDGRWMAYYSDESGQSEVYVQPFPGPGRRLQISTDGGRNPVWSPNGRELFYVGYPRMIMAVDVVTEPDFTAGTPRVLFEAPHFVGVGRGYDITPDGQRFVMVRRDEEAASPAGGRQLNVVLNWFEELKRLVPVKN